MQAHKDGSTLIEAGGPEGLGYFTEEQYTEWVIPKDMTHPKMEKGGTWYNGVPPTFDSA